MSIIASNRTFFSDGESIISEDLNAISVNMTRRAWDAPGYAQLVGFDEISPSGMRPYGDAFDGDSSAMYARKRGVFTVGRGLTPAFINFSSAAGSGFLGIWSDPSGPAPPPASGANRMIWASISGGDIGATHTPAAAGKTRWDLVCVTVQEIDAATVTRDFKDATTGAETSESVVPGKGYTFATYVISGDESSGTADMPFISSGQYAVYGALVSNTAVIGVWDFAVPVGEVKHGVTLGREGMPFGSELSSPPWVVAQNQREMKSVTSAVGELLIFPPENVRGAPASLLLGIKIDHKLYAGNTVKLSCWPLSVGSMSDIVDLSSSITKDGSVRSKALDLRGAPYSERTPPIWMNGTNGKGATDSTLCLRINAQSDTNESRIYAVRWFYL